MATQEILVKYKADISDLQAKVTLLEQQFAKVKKGVTDTGSGFKNLGSALAPLGAAIAGAFAVDQVIAFGKESVKAFQEAELNAKKLQTAVSVSGGLQGDFDALLDQSKELQKITIFSDDAVQNAQTAALQFGLTSDEVEKLIPIVSDFASATGQQLQPALDSVLRGLEGQGRGLKLYGINVDAAASRAENLSSITQQLTGKFEGQAKIVGETGAGSIARYNHELDELKEQLGEKLEPIFIGITEAAVSFTEAIVDTIDVISDLGRGIQAIAFGDFSGELKQQLKELQTLTQNAKKENADLVASFVESFKGLSEGQIKARLETYQRLLAEANKARKEAVNSSQAEKNAIDQNIVTYASASIALREVTAAREAENEAQKLSIENLKKLSTEQLKALETQLKPKQDSTSKDAIENIKKILEERRKAGIEEAKAIAAQNEARIAAQQKADDELLQMSVDAIKDDFEKRRSQSELDFLRFEKEKDEQLKQGLINQETRNALVKAADEKQQKELANINAEEDTSLRDKGFKDRLASIDKFNKEEITRLQNAFIAEGDFSAKAQKELEDKVAETDLQGLKERLIAAQNSGVDVTDLLNQIAEKEIDINKNKNDEILKQEAEAAEKRKQLFEDIRNGYELSAQAITAISDLVLGQQIEALNSQKTVNTEFFDSQQKEIDDNVEKRLITEGQGEARSAKLKEQRSQSEKKSNEELKKLQRQQAEIKKALAIFDAGINLAQAISVALSAAPPPFNAALAAISAALAGIQLAAIIATPIPKFKEGVSYLERGRNAQGTDTIPVWADEGERIVSKSKNIKHWDIYEAIDENRFHQYVMKNFVTPALKNQQRTYEENKQRTFADNIGQSIVHNGLTFHEADRIRRRGTRINNQTELAKEIASEVAKAITRQIAYDR